jgi:RES domain-containing protein
MSVDDFVAKLPDTPVRPMEGTLVRRVALVPMIEATSVDFLFTSGKAYRYNPRGVQCIYFAEDDATAAAEYERHIAGNRQPFATYFASVRVRRLIDLCDPQTIKALGFPAREMRTPWVGARKPTLMQQLGEAVSRQNQIAAIRFPSEAARAKGLIGANVVIFRNAVRRPDCVQILGPTKHPLQKWP